MMLDEVFELGSLTSFGSCGVELSAWLAVTIIDRMAIVATGNEGLAIIAAV